jgi:hypothetical protein
MANPTRPGAWKEPAVVRSRWIRAGVALGSAVLLAVGAIAPATAHGPSIEVVAGGLNNPRGIDLDGKGGALVAVTGEGRIIRVSDEGVSNVVTGLPVAELGEGEFSGVVDVDRGFGRTLAVIGGGPQNVDGRFMTLRKVTGSTTTRLADIQAHQVADPDPTDLDEPPNPTESNPYGVTAGPLGLTLVADAAGNDLLVYHRGKLRTVARFPNEVVPTDHVPFPVPPELPAEAVPTQVVIGPDGYWYVSELKGFPFAPGESRIWRVAPWARNVDCDPAATSGPCRVFADGFTSVIGIAFGRDRSLYVLEFARNGLLDQSEANTGRLVRVKGSTRTEIAAGRLLFPGGLAVQADGTIWVTNRSIIPGAGEVLAIKP